MHNLHSPLELLLKVVVYGIKSNDVFKFRIRFFFYKICILYYTYLQYQVLRSLLTSLQHQHGHLTACAFNYPAFLTTISFILFIVSFNYLFSIPFPWLKKMRQHWSWMDIDIYWKFSWYTRHCLHSDLVLWHVNMVW